MIAVYVMRNDSMKLYETLKRNRIPAQIINTPRDLSLGCGLSVAFNDRDINQVRSVISRLSTHSFRGIWRNNMGVFSRIY